MKGFRCIARAIRIIDYFKRGVIASGSICLKSHVGKGSSAQVDDFDFEEFSSLSGSDIIILLSILLDIKLSGFKLIVRPFSFGNKK